MQLLKISLNYTDCNSRHRTSADSLKAENHSVEMIDEGINIACAKDYYLLSFNESRRNKMITEVN